MAVRFKKIWSTLQEGLNKSNMKLMKQAVRKGSMMVYGKDSSVWKPIEKECHKLHGKTVKVLRAEKTAVRKLFGVDSSEKSGMRKELYSSYKSLVVCTEALEISALTAKSKKQVVSKVEVGEYVVINGKRLKRIR